MKKVTRLLRPKSKKAKDAQYNALSAANGNGGSARIDASATEPMPTIHNYGKSKTKVKTKSTKTQPTKVKLTSARTKNQTPSTRTGDAAYTTVALERASTSSTTDNNNFNYSSLNRKRNSYSNSSCGSIITRDTTTPTATASTASKQTLQKRRSHSRKRWWRRLLCYNRCACARRKRATQPHNRYKDYWNEPAKKQKRQRCCSCRAGWRKRVGAAKCWRWCCLPCCCCDRRTGSYPYDSEEDDDIDGKFAAYIYEMQQRDMVALPAALADTTPTIATTQLQKEAKAAAEESNQSPVIGKRNESTASPIQSRGSGTSETWPAQSDEDIDRLVAMHQNRDSLSSLGLRSDSMASVYSGAGEGRYGTVVVKGQVEFGMQYNYKLGALEIHVVRCKDLAAVDVKRNRSDPYVKVYLLPDKSKAGKRKTKVKKHTLNPIFDEILRFHMPISSLESRTLWLTVWHSDMFGRNDFLGEVSVSLQGKVFDNPQSQWYLLQERSEPFDEIATYRGDIVVGLKYIPPEMVRPGFMRSASTSSGSSNLRKFGSIKSVASRSDRSTKGGQLHVLVKEAKHLSPIKVNGTCDAFCKSYLLPDRTRSSKQKTPVVKRSLHPTWNYTFIYEDVSLDDLSERALELTVWDHDRLASNEFLGGVRFSLGTGKSYGRPVEWMDATGKELSLWQNMIDRPNFWVEGSLILRSTLDGIRAIP